MKKFGKWNLLAVMTVAALGVFGTHQAEAPAQTPMSFAALRLAASGFSPLPTTKLYS